MTEHPRHTAVVALTGGVASGKTAVTSRFAALGIPIIDTDILAREVVEPGTAGLAALVDLVGAEILLEDGQLDRRALRHRIIEDAALRRSVEQLLHPRIEQLSRDRIAASHGPYCMIAIPLLVESSRFDWVDRVLVVDVPEALQIERLMARDAMTREQAAAMLATQANRQQRLAIADDVIENSGTLAELDQAVEKLHQQYLQLFSKTTRTDS
ncbi:MAG: dephospho-CoA kinase [Wenzhouxiangellaceae bacterium]